MVLPAEFQRYRSIPMCFRQPLLTAVVVAACGGVLICAAAVCCGLGFVILFPRLHPENGFPLFGQLISLPVAVQQLPVRVAVILSCSAAIGCIVLSYLTGQLGERLAARFAAAETSRLQQSLQRKAIRLQPADLSGSVASQAELLCTSILPRFESETAVWFSRRCTVITHLPLISIALLGSEWRPALQLAIPVLAGQYLIASERRRANSTLSVMMEELSTRQQELPQSFERARLVTAYGMEQEEQEQFLDRLSLLRRQSEKLNSRQQTHRLLIFLLQLFMPAITMTLIGLQLHAGLLPATAACMAVLLLGLYNTAGQFLHVESSDSAAQLDQLSTFLDSVPSVSQRPGASFLQPLAKTLTLNQVTLHSAALGDIVRKLDLRITAGERIGLISTEMTAAHAVAAMLPRFIDPDAGQILIDGNDIRDATLESLRAEVVLVSENDPVLNATALENITCGQADVSRQQAIEAAKTVHADSFLRNLPQGYDTRLGEQGQRLRHEQVFRLGLARALVRDPALLIIQEPQHRMDQAEKDLLDDAFQRLSIRRTLILIPGRLSTLRRCDKVILLDRGQVAAEGSYEELIHSSELYRHWEYTNFNSFRNRPASQP